MSVPAVQGLSVKASHLFNVVKNCTAVIGTRLVGVCQYRFVAGTALVASTVAGFIIGWKLYERISELDDHISDAVFYGMSAIGILASVAAINILVSKKLQLPLPIWGSVLITITTMTIIGLAIPNPPDFEPDVE